MTELRGSQVCKGGHCRGTVRHWLVVILSTAMATVCCTNLPAQAQKDKEPASGVSTRQAQAEAEKAIPYDDLTADGRRKVDAVLSGVTLFRRMPTQVIRCDGEMYGYLIERPDVTANLWQVLGISNCSVEQTGESTFRADDGGGARGDLQYLYSDHETQLVYAVGTCQGALFTKSVKGGCLLLLKTGYVREPDGNQYITSRMDVFLRIDNAAMELVTKTFQSTFNKAADQNFVQSMKFVGQLSRVAEVRPQQLLNLCTKLDKVRGEDRQQFSKLVQNIAQRYEARVAERVDDSEEPPPELPRSTIPPPKLRR